MSDTQRIRHIDAWRFIAVSLVIVAHVISYSNLRFLAETVPGVWRLGRFGTLGVLIFFFISGFVICRGLIEERAAASAVSLKAFYVRRAFRILPPLWLWLVAATLMAAVGWGGRGSITLTQVNRAALFLCNMRSAEGCSEVAGHTWSLAYEEQFYLVFPLLFVVLSLAVQPRILLVILVLMIGGSLSLRWAGADWWAEYLANMVFLLTGCAAALYKHRLDALCTWLSVRHWCLAFGVLIGCVGLLPLSLDGWVKTVLYPPLIGLLVLGTPVSHPKVSAFFQNPLISYLGKISYTVYLWQQLATGQYPTLAPWWTVLFVVCVWLFAHFSYQYFERPLIGVATRWSEAIKRRAFFGRAVGSSS